MNNAEEIIAELQAKLRRADEYHVAMEDTIHDQAVEIDRLQLALQVHAGIRYSTDLSNGQREMITQAVREATEGKD